MNADIYASIFARSLGETLEKSAFVPMGAAEKQAQQAAGPDGMPVDPAAAGGAPMDPAAAGMPMDPAAMGAPMDPAAAGMPVDPAAMDPAAMDPAAMGAPAEGGIPSPEEMGLDPAALGIGEDAGGAGGAEGLTSDDVDSVLRIQEQTTSQVVDVAERIIGAMKGGGKAKAADKPEEAAAPAGDVVEQAAELAAGPVTGQPGFDPASFGQVGDKLAALDEALARVLGPEGV